MEEGENRTAMRRMSCFRGRWEGYNRKCEEKEAGKAEEPEQHSFEVFPQGFVKCDLEIWRRFVRSFASADDSDSGRY